MGPNNEIKKIGASEGHTQFKTHKFEADEFFSGHKVWQNGDPMDEDNYGKIHAISFISIKKPLPEVPIPDSFEKSNV